MSASEGTFSSFYYFKHQDQYLFLSVQTFKVVYRITLIDLVIGKAQFRRAMLSCDSSCLDWPVCHSQSHSMTLSVETGNTQLKLVIPT